MSSAQQHFGATSPKLGQLPPPDTLARIAAGKAADQDEVKMTRERILPIAKQLRNGLADSVLAVASRAGSPSEGRL